MTAAAAAAPKRSRTWIGSTVLLLTVLGVGAGLAAWKQRSVAKAQAAAQQQPEPMEAVTVAAAAEREHRRITVAIGTVVALRSITLHNELAGTVAQAALEPGQIVEPGTVLVALDVSVEEAELQAQQAQAALADTMLERMQRAQSKSAASEVDVDRARSERDVAHAQVARLRAIIARKTTRAPFRARVGMADVHVGQYLHEGTQLTTLQGIDDAVHIDFAVTQTVAAGLKAGDQVEVLTGAGAAASSGAASPVAASAGAALPVAASIEALDARIDPSTRNTWVRARLEHAGQGPLPGASVRVRVPVGPTMSAVTVPVSALRKGPGGDHVFVIAAGSDGKPRAHERRVQAGPVVGDDVVILEGLQAGEQVAASGSFKLHESVLVAITNATNATEAAGRDR